MTRIAIAGLGYRGMAAAERLRLIPGAEVTALCDPCADTLDKARGLWPRAAAFGGPDGWKRLCAEAVSDIVYICTPWTTHAEIAAFAMQNGRNAAVEAPFVTSLEECRLLLETSAATGRFCTLLENCLYDPFESAVVAMAADGLFGEINFAEGGYLHFLTQHQQWRDAFNSAHQGDNYPTHGIASISRILGIGSTDRFRTLTSFFSGGHTTTVLNTRLGRTVILRHDVSSCRPYSRLFSINGSKGCACKYPSEMLAFSEEYLSLAQTAETLRHYRKPAVAAAEELMPQGTEAKRLMDYAMDYTLVSRFEAGLAPDVSTAEAATWSAIAPLSRLSIGRGSKIVDFPKI